MATIVLAEDDVHILRVVSIWLKQHHHQVYEANNGQKALDLVRAHAADLLITDVNMPVMDGLALVQTCQLIGLPKIGIIVLTSRCDQKDICDVLTGPNVVLHPKPFSPSRLVREVEGLLSRAGVPAAGSKE